MSTHQIRRQRLEVRAPSESAAFEWRRALRSRLEGDILPAVERTLERHDRPDEEVHIDRLSVTLRGHDVDDLLRRLEEELDRALATALAGRDAPSSAVHPRSPDRQGDPHAWLEHYLATGQLPWHAPRAERATLLSALRAAARAVVRASGGPVPPAVPAASRRAWARRLLELLDRDDVVALATTIGAARGHASALVRRATTSFAPAKGARPIGAEDTSAHLLTTALAALVRADATPLALRRETLALLVAEERLESMREARDLLARAPAELLASIASAPATDTSALHAPAHLVPIEARPATAPPADVLNAARRDEASVAGDVSRTSIAARTDDLGAVAPDAGLVLLHPFLPQLFETLGIVARGARVIDEDRIARALSLLAWLTSGCDEAFEFDSVVAKVLVGRTPSDPIGVSADRLTDDDRGECDAMLRAAIGHWPALRSTSVEGLRSAFLRRPGLLARDERQWRLDVEPAAQDLLLSHLSWGFAVIRLPWMPLPLLTEWPTP